MTTAKMSNLLNLWRSATCEHLNKLLTEEYPYTNLPHVVRSQPSGQESNQTIEREYTYVGVVYWSHLTEMAPGVFTNPLAEGGQFPADTLAFTQATLYVPRARLVKRNGSWAYWVWTSNGWVPIPRRDNWPVAWNLFNQNWMARIVPATSESIVTILQQPSPGGSSRGLPLRDGDMRYIRDVNMH